MRRATSKVLALVNDQLAPFGLRRTTFSALSIVVDRPGIHQSQLAEALSIERPNIVQLIDELEVAGLLRRVAVAGDRRVRGLEPTIEGKRQYQKALDRIQRVERGLTRNLSSEQIATLHEALEVIEENAERQRTDAAPVLQP